MNNPIASAIKQISDEKGIPQEQIVEALEAALAAAYRKDFGQKNQNIKVEFDIKTGGSRVFDVKTVVEDMEEPLEEADGEGLGVTSKESAKDKQTSIADTSDGAEGEEEKKRFNPKLEVMISHARADHTDAQIGDVLKTELIVPAEYGRMAAQTAKQVIIQKIREAERTMLFQGFKGREGTIMVGTVQRREENRVLVDFGKVSGVLPASEQIPRERYAVGDRIKVYVASVHQTIKGPETLLSRIHPNMVRIVFEHEIPEIASGVIEIKGVSREAGARSKVAVWTASSAIDPIGSCIGQRGSRIQTIISELGGEKVDVILYDDDPDVFIANALSPAKVSSTKLDAEAHQATVIVKDDQLSLAIGKQGQNVRLASQLTGWNINVRGEHESDTAGFVDPDTEIQEKEIETDQSIAEILESEAAKGADDEDQALDTPQTPTLDTLDTIDKP